VKSPLVCECSAVYVVLFGAILWALAIPRYCLVVCCNNNCGLQCDLPRDTCKTLWVADMVLNTAEYAKYCALLCSYSHLYIIHRTVYMHHMVD